MQLSSSPLSSSIDYTYTRVCTEHKAPLDDTRGDDPHFKTNGDNMWCAAGKHIVHANPWTWHKADGWTVVRNDGKVVYIVEPGEYESYETT